MRADEPNTQKHGIGESEQPVRPLLCILTLGIGRLQVHQLESDPIEMVCRVLKIHAIEQGLKRSIGGLIRDS